MVDFRGLILLLACAAAGGYAPALWAEEPAVDKQTVLTVYTAFECSALAKIAEYRDEAPRFRDIGYYAGLAVHAALEEGQVTREELTVPIPAMNLLTIEGPSTDFILGVHYEFAFSMLMREIIFAIGVKGTRKDRIAEAHARYTDKGCPGLLLDHGTIPTTSEPAPR